MDDRRSEYTTPRSLSTTFGSKSRFRMRSDSRSKIRLVAEFGNQSWYTVTSELVYALLRPPFASITRSNSPGGRVDVPLNIMCSKKCEMPVIPGRSLRLPTRKNVYSATFGMSLSGQTTILRPFGSVLVVIWSAPGKVAAEASAELAAMASATAAAATPARPIQLRTMSMRGMRPPIQE
jgi:hypothetical protein